MDRGELDLDDAAPALAREIDAGVRHQAVQPVVERLGIAQPRQAAPRPDQGLLDGVLGQFRVAKDEASGGIQARAGHADELGEGVPVAFASSLHEFRSVHGRLWASGTTMVAVLAGLRRWRGWEWFPIRGSLPREALPPSDRRGGPTGRGDLAGRAVPELFPELRAVHGALGEDRRTVRRPLLPRAVARDRSLADDVGPASRVDDHRPSEGLARLAALDQQPLALGIPERPGFERDSRCMAHDPVTLTVDTDDMDLDAEGLPVLQRLRQVLSVGT